MIATATEGLPLFASARRSDPETSQQAAAGIRRLTARHAAVWQVLRAITDATDDQLIHSYEYYGSVKQSASSIRSRRHELEQHRLVEATGAKRPSSNGGHPSRVFRAIDQERADRLFAEVGV